MKFLRYLWGTPLLLLPIALLLGVALCWVIARPTAADAPVLSRADRRHLQRVVDELRTRAATDTLHARLLLDTAHAYQNRGLALLHHEPIADTLAALRYADSTLASWK